MNQAEFRNDAPAEYADAWHSGGDVVTVLHLRAENDVNGNPRRCFVGVDGLGHVVAVQDEGYAGTHDWVRAAYVAGIYPLSIRVPAGEYADYMRRVELNRGRFGIVKREDAKAAGWLTDDDGNVYAETGSIYSRRFTRRRAGQAIRREYSWTSGLVAIDLADAGMDAKDGAK